MTMVVADAGGLRKAGKACRDKANLHEQKPEEAR